MIMKMAVYSVFDATLDEILDQFPTEQEAVICAKKIVDELTEEDIGGWVIEVRRETAELVPVSYEHVPNRFSENKDTWIVTRWLEPVVVDRYKSTGDN